MSQVVFCRYRKRGQTWRQMKLHVWHQNFKHRDHQGTYAEPTAEHVHMACVASQNYNGIIKLADDLLNLCLPCNKNRFSAWRSFILLYLLCLYDFYKVKGSNCKTKVCVWTGGQWQGDNRVYVCVVSVEPVAVRLQELTEIFSRLCSVSVVDRRLGTENQWTTFWK